MDPSSNFDPLARSGEVRKAQCPEHGEFMSRHIIGKIWSKCEVCAAVHEQAQQRQADERRAAEAIRVRHEALGRAGIPARFGSRSFDNYLVTTDHQRHAVTTCRAYAEAISDHVRRGTGLILAGSPGTGKTHLAAAILRSVLPRDVLYITGADLVRSIRATWRRDSAATEAQVSDRLHRLDLLVIDEVGAQHGTDFEQTILFDVVDNRYRDVRPTILVTNQDRAGLRVCLGERSFDRIAEICKLVPFDWPSYRPQARRGPVE